MKKLSEYLPNFFDDSNKELYDLTRLWNNAAGELIASISMPISLKNGELLVGVSDNMWLSELSMMKDDLMERITVENSGITDLRFVFRMQNRDIKPKPKKFKQVSEREREIVARHVNAIEDEKLKAAVEKAMLSYFTVYGADDFFKIVKS